MMSVENVLIVEINKNNMSYYKEIIEDNKKQLKADGMTEEEIAKIKGPNKYKIYTLKLNK